MKATRTITRMTPITIPAMAPPLNPVSFFNVLKVNQGVDENVLSSIKALKNAR